MPMVGRRLRSPPFSIPRSGAERSPRPTVSHSTGLDNTPMSNHLLDRRTYLKGMGVALALPLLESMGWAEPDRKKGAKPPVRLGFMYMPHGVIMNQFWPASPESFLTAPPPALE